MAFLVAAMACVTAGALPRPLLATPRITLCQHLARPRRPRVPTAAALAVRMLSSADAGHAQPPDESQPDGGEGDQLTAGDEHISDPSPPLRNYAPTAPRTGRLRAAPTVHQG
jgi:hypothetical protein